MGLHLIKAPASTDGFLGSRAGQGEAVRAKETPGTMELVSSSGGESVRRRQVTFPADGLCFTISILCFSSTCNKQVK